MQLPLVATRHAWVGIMILALVSGACASGTTAGGPAAFPRAPAPASAGRSAPGAESIAVAVVHTALSFVGTPYRLGGDTPGRGFDCSGLVRYALAQHRVDMPRTVAEQFSVGRPVSGDDLQAGDLVFFSTIGPGATHVGIVLEDASTFVHAPSEGGVVRTEPIGASYWRSRFVGARRIF